MNHPDDGESSESSLATTGPAWKVRALPAGMHRALAYLLRRLEEHDGIIAHPVSFRNQTTIRNAAIPAQDSPGKVPVLISNELMRVVSYCPETDQASLIRDRQIANAQSRIGESMLTRVVRHAFHDVNSKVGASPRFVQLLLDAGADPLVCCDSGKNVIHDLIWSAVPDEVEEEAAVMERSSKIFESVLRSAGRAGMLSLLLCADRHGTTPCEYFKTEKHTNWQELLESVVTYRAVKQPRSHPVTQDQSFPKIARTAAVVQPTKKRTLLLDDDVPTQKTIMRCHHTKNPHRVMKRKCPFNQVHPEVDQAYTSGTSQELETDIAATAPSVYCGSEHSRIELNNVALKKSALCLEIPEAEDGSMPYSNAAELAKLEETMLEQGIKILESQQPEAEQTSVSYETFFFPGRTSGSNDGDQKQVTDRPDSGLSPSSDLSDLYGLSSSINVHRTPCENLTNSSSNVSADSNCTYS